MNKEDIIEEALAQLEELPGGVDGTPFIVGDKRYYDYLLSSLIDTSPLDSDVDLISRRRIGFELDSILRNIKGEDSPIESFLDAEQDKISEIKSSDLEEYDLYFPLNICPENNIPNKFTPLDRQLTRINESVWHNRRELAIEEDDTHLNRFLTKHPNSFDGSRSPYTEEFCYWKLSLQARGVSYAMSMAHDTLQYFLGKMNYCVNHSQLRSYGANNSFVPRLRWSELRTPPIFLVFIEDSYEEFSIAEFSRRRTEKPLWEESRTEKTPKERFRDIPSFAPEKNEVDWLIVEGFRSFQRGISTHNTNHSLFEFWKGIENLALIERQQGKATAAARAEFARKHSIGEADDPLLSDINIAEKRNALVHDIGDVGVGHVSQEKGKVLLEGLLDFYLSFKSELDNKEVTRELLDWGASSTDKLQLTKDALERLESIRESS